MNIFVLIVSHASEQDLSLAGKRAGMSLSQKDGGTRSGLLWEFERIITECKELGYEHMPQILIMENVPAIHSEKDMPNFSKWMSRLEELGYSNYWKDLNAKNYGIPQNRDRCFMVSILKDKDGNEYNYKFPTKFKRDINLKDMLEKEVDEKYYLNQKMIDYVTGVNYDNPKFDRAKAFQSKMDSIKRQGVSGTITTREGDRANDTFIIEDDIKTVGNYMPSGHNAGRVVDPDGLAPTVMENHGTVTAVMEKDNSFVANKYKEYMEENSCDIPEMFNPYNKQEVDELAPTQTTQCGSSTSSSTVLIREATKQGYKEAYEGDGINIGGRMQYQRGNVQDGMAQTLKTTCEVGVVVKEEIDLKTELCNKLVNEGLVKEGDVIYHSFANNRLDEKRDINSIQNSKDHDSAPTITTRADCLGVVVKENRPQLRIRKLTPKECMRLMSFQDIDCDHMMEVGLSNNAIYHCAGDSICVNVIIGIIGKLFGLDNIQVKDIIKKYINTIKSID